MKCLTRSPCFLGLRPPRGRGARGDAGGPRGGRGFLWGGSGGGSQDPAGSSRCLDVFAVLRRVFSMPESSDRQGGTSPNARDGTSPTVEGCRTGRGTIEQERDAGARGAGGAAAAPEGAGPLHGQAPGSAGRAAASADDARGSSSAERRRLFPGPSSAPS